MQIRRACESEIDKINATIRAAKSYWKYPEKYLEAAKTLLEITPTYLEENLCFQVLNSIDATVGFFAISEERHDKFIDHLWIEPGSIGKGFGRFVLSYIDSLAARKSWSTLFVLPDPGAIGFYLRLGFVDSGLSCPSRIEGGPVFKILRKSFGTTSNQPFYSPKFFLETDFRLIRKLIDDNGFATLLSNNNPELFSHLPFILQTDDEGGSVLISHMARANTQWQELARAGRARAIFNGPHAYISPSWYLPNASNVPTWNYLVVHVTGDFKITVDKQTALQDMKSLVERFESRYSTSWNMPMAEPTINAMMENIVAFRITDLNFDAKFKLSQQQIAANRNRVVHHLNEAGHTNLANYMKLTTKPE